MDAEEGRQFARRSPWHSATGARIVRGADPRHAQRAHRRRVEGLSHATFRRTPDTCRHRVPASPDGAASCGLVDTLLGEAVSNVRVALEACEACCQSFDPTARDLNPVVASLLWQAVDERLTNESLSESERDRLSRLQSHAERNLPVVLPDEQELHVVETSLHDPSTPRFSIDDIARALPMDAAPSRAISRWAVGVTTSPRRVPTLALGLRSLMGAGWEQPDLFIDGDVEVAPEFDHLPRTIHRPGIGARQSYYLAVVALLQRHPSADAIMVVQDDAIWPRTAPVRDYLEAVLDIIERPMLVSAWCCSDDTAATAGWHTMPRTWKFGAVAFIYPRALAERFVNDAIVKRVCASLPENQTGGLSAIIGDWAARNHIPVRFPTPSLVQHAGEVSTIWEHSRAVGVRRASRYLGDELLALRGDLR